MRSVCHRRRSPTRTRNEGSGGASGTVSRAPTRIPEDGRILCIRLSARGDTLLTFPAVAALRRRFPRAHIAFLTDARYAELLQGSDPIDEVILLDRLALKGVRPAGIRSLFGDVLRPLATGRWDAVIDFQSYTETALLGALTRAPVRLGRRYKTTASWLYHPWIDAPHPAAYMPFAHLDTLARAGLSEVAPSDLDRYFTVPVQARTAWSTTLAGLGLPAAARRVGLFVGAAQTNRRWPAERFARLAVELDRASVAPLSFIVLAGPDEGAVADAVIAAAGSSLSGRCVRAPTASLLELAAAFEDCAAAVCNDTGPLHLSIAVGTPTCGVYRRPLPHFLAPPPHRQVVAPDKRVDRISVDEVLAAASELLRCHADVP